MKSHTIKREEGEKSKLLYYPCFGSHFVSILIHFLTWTQFCFPSSQMALSLTIIQPLPNKTADSLVLISSLKSQPSGAKKNQEKGVRE